MGREGDREQVQRSFTVTSMTMASAATPRKGLLDRKRMAKAVLKVPNGFATAVKERAVMVRKNCWNRDTLVSIHVTHQQTVLFVHPNGVLGVPLSFSIRLF